MSYQQASGHERNDAGEGMLTAHLPKVILQRYLKFGLP
jgi:hypothetical protein